MLYLSFLFLSYTVFFLVQKNFFVNNSKHLALVVEIFSDNCLSMKFCICQPRSVELFTGILNLLAKCRWKFPATILYLLISVTLCFCQQNVGGAFQ